MTDLPVIARVVIAVLFLVMCVGLFVCGNRLMAAVLAFLDKRK